MSTPTGQSFSNHVRIVPLFHGVTFVLLVVPTVGVIRAAIQHPGTATVMPALFHVGIILLFFFARLFALTVQDRVIRLEETLRLERLLPSDLKPRIGELTREQFVALRFAPDAELPELVRRTLAGEFASPAAIKKAVKNWRGDYLRV